MTVQLSQEQRQRREKRKIHRSSKEGERSAYPPGMEGGRKGAARTFHGRLVILRESDCREISWNGG